MKKNLRNKSFGLRLSHAFLVMSLVLGVMLASCDREAAHAHNEYTCPMHPTVISDRPGSCPVCGMDLVRKTTTSENQTVDKNLTDVLKSPNESVIANVRTIKGEFKAVPVTYEAQGIVTYDTRNIFTISSRVAGRIEKLYIKFPYQSVSKGQRVADIYSPELITAQRELLFLLENDADNTNLIEAAKKRLRLLGLSNGQLSALITNRNAGNTVTLYSPHDGYVISSSDLNTEVSSSSTAQPDAGGMSDGMSGTSPEAVSSAGPVVSSTDASIIREGNYINAGQTIFTVVNNSSLRVELDLPADLASSIQHGDKLKMDFGAGHEHVGVIDFVQPFFDKDREFVKVRVNTNNTENLHIGHLLQAKIRSDSIEGLWVPRQAVVDLGREQIVFVQRNNTFTPHVVTTGLNTAGMTRILKGLTTSDEIAENAQFLVDSESIIKHGN